MKRTNRVVDLWREEIKINGELDFSTQTVLLYLCNYHPIQYLAHNELVFSFQKHLMKRISYGPENPSKLIMHLWCGHII